MASSQFASNMFDRNVIMIFAAVEQSNLDLVLGSRKGATAPNGNKLHRCLWPQPHGVASRRRS